MIIKFTSDEAVEHSSGFKIEYSVVPDDSSVAPALSGEIRTSAGAEAKKSSAPTGLIIGLLLIAIAPDSKIFQKFRIFDNFFYFSLNFLREFVFESGIKSH